MTLTLTHTAEPPRRAQAPRRRATALDRIIAIVVALGCLATLSAAAWLTPSSDGFGTHTQLGVGEVRLQACAWPQHFGVPCATCGMTTAFAHAANGHLLSSAKAQPMGAALAVMTATAFWIALHIALTGSRPGAMLSALTRPRFFLAMGALLLLSWVYKILTWTG